MPDSSPAPEASITTRSSARTTASASSGKNDPRKLHFVLQGKGGVGKTFVSLLLSQAIAGRGEPVICIDTDPVNASLSSLSTLPSERVSVFEGKRVDVRALDALTERLLSEEAHFVIDNGASSFVPVSHYLIENDVTQLIAEEGRQLVIHTVITGGPSMLDTMKGLESLLTDFPNAIRMVVWLNDFFGPIVNANGKPFEELPAYIESKSKIYALVRLPAVSDEVSADVREMVGKRQSFDQALARDNVALLRVQKSRLFKFKQSIWPSIERVI